MSGDEVLGSFASMGYRERCSPRRMQIGMTVDDLVVFDYVSDDKILVPVRIFLHNEDAVDYAENGKYLTSLVPTGEAYIRTVQPDREYGLPFYVVFFEYER